MSLSAADWTLLQDFTDNTEGFDLTLARNNSGEIILTQDPADAANNVMYVESGNYGVTDYNTTYATIALPDPVAEGETVTLYWRYYMEGPGNNFHVSLSDVAKEQDTGTGDWIEPNAWSDMESVFRLLMGEVTVRDGSQYPVVGTGLDEASFVPLILASGTWYEFWMVANNNNGAFEDDYQIYVRGGEFADITLLTIKENDQASGEPTGFYWESAYFRNGTTDALVSLIIGTESGSAGDPFAGDVWYIDDLYVTSGAVTDEAPVSGNGSEEWAGFPFLDEAGIVDTGSLLGLVNVAHAPYIFSYKFGAYLYIEESLVAEDGAWAWFFEGSRAPGETDAANAPFIWSTAAGDYLYTEAVEFSTNGGCAFICDVI